MISRILLEALDSPEMAVSGVMVGILSLRMRIAGDVSMISRAGSMLGVCGAFQSKLRHERHRAEATGVLKSSRTMNINGKYRFGEFFNFCVGWFFKIISISR